jgi:hypothetical protein
VEPETLHAVIGAIRQKLTSIREKLPDSDGTIRAEIRLRKGGVRQVKVEVEFPEETS